MSSFSTPDKPTGALHLPPRHGLKRSPAPFTPQQKGAYALTYEVESVFDTASFKRDSKDLFAPPTPAPPRKMVKMMPSQTSSSTASPPPSKVEPAAKRKLTVAETLHSMKPATPSYMLEEENIYRSSRPPSYFQPPNPPPQSSRPSPLPIPPPPAPMPPPKPPLSNAHLHTKQHLKNMKHVMERPAPDLLKEFRSLPRIPKPDTEGRRQEFLMEEEAYALKQQADQEKKRQEKKKQFQREQAIERGEILEGSDEEEEQKLVFGHKAPAPSLHPAKPVQPLKPALKSILKPPKPGFPSLLSAEQVTAWQGHNPLSKHDDAFMHHPLFEKLFNFASKIKLKKQADWNDIWNGSLSVSYRHYNKVLTLEDLKRDWTQATFDVFLPSFLTPAFRAKLIDIQTLLNRYVSMFRQPAFSLYELITLSERLKNPNTSFVKWIELDWNNPIGTIKHRWEQKVYNENILYCMQHIMGNERGLDRWNVNVDDDEERAALELELLS